MARWFLSHFNYSISIFFPTHAKSEGRKARKIWSHLCSWVNFQNYTRDRVLCTFPKHHIGGKSCLVRLLLPPPPPLSSAFFCVIRIPQAILEKYPEKIIYFPSDIGGNLSTSCFPLSLCVVIDLIWDSGIRLYLYIFGDTNLIQPAVPHLACGVLGMPSMSSLHFWLC